MNYKIGVIGDAMIDEYYSVKIKGISPEFPIPAMHSCDSLPRVFPGGAANVVRQFEYFRKASPYLVSFLDSYFLNCFPKLENLEYSRIIDPFNIPIKRRFYSDGLPTYRWDIEKDNYGLGSSINSYCLNLYNGFFSVLSDFDAIIFSDYCKGVFFPNFDYVPKKILTVVDSKSKDVDKWFGCTIFKSNFKEATELSGKSNAIDAGFWIKSRIKCEHVVITNAEKGVTIVSSEGVKAIDPLPVNHAVSVIGAGDCFTSVLTFYLLEGLNVLEATEKAWKAGCVYVGKSHNSPVAPIDLVDGKDLEEPSVLKDRGFKLVFTNGCFDLLHSGHIETLKFAKSKGEKLVVALNSDSSVSRLKPNRPIQPLKDRINILSSLSFVDYVVSFDEDTPLEVIKKINPDVLVKGAEYDFNQIVGSDIIKEVFVSPMVDGLSTSNLLRRLQNF